VHLTSSSRAPDEFVTCTKRLRLRTRRVRFVHRTTSFAHRTSSPRAQTSSLRAPEQLLKCANEFTSCTDRVHLVHNRVRLVHTTSSLCASNEFESCTRRLHFGHSEKPQLSRPGLAELRMVIVTGAYGHLTFHKRDRRKRSSKPAFRSLVNAPNRVRCCGR